MRNPTIATFRAIATETAATLDDMIKSGFYNADNLSRDVVAETAFECVVDVEESLRITEDDIDTPRYIALLNAVHRAAEAATDETHTDPLRMFSPEAFVLVAWAAYKEEMKS